MSPHKEAVPSQNADSRIQAIAVLDQLLLHSPADIEALQSRIDLAIASHDLTTVTTLLENAVAACPTSAEIAVLSAKTYLTIKDFKRSALECGRALRIDPSCNMIHTLAGAQMPGPTYLYHLRWIHNSIKPRIYLEIGVDNGSTLRLARADCAVFGIDPAPAIDPSLRARISLFETTSDSFFSTHAPQVLGNRKISVAFIDGLHLFEQVLRDFLNVERYCDKSSIIAIHDTLPVSASLASRERLSMFWCGDVWKIVPCLRAHRPDLKISTIPTFPSGLTIITNADSANTTLNDNYETIVNEYIEQPYSAYAPSIERTFRTIPNSLLNLLPSQ